MSAKVDKVLMNASYIHTCPMCHPNMSIKKKREEKNSRRHNKCEEIQSLTWNYDHQSMEETLPYRIFLFYSYYRQMDAS